MKNNYIAISVWEIDNPMTLLHDIESIRQTYQGWKIILYHDQSIGRKTINQLENFEVALVDMSTTDMHPSLWKFQAANLPDMGYAIFRDSEIGIFDEKDWRNQIDYLNFSGADKDVFDSLDTRNSNSVMSFICSVMMPVVEFNKFIGVL